MSNVLAKTDHKYIKVNPQRGTYIKGTRIRVKNIIIHYKSGMPVEEILEGFPNITPAQFYDALSYYYDYKEQIEKEIREEDLQEIEKKFNLKLQLNGTLKVRNGQDTNLPR